MASQPYLHHLTGVFCAPIQCWSAEDGQIGGQIGGPVGGQSGGGESDGQSGAGEVGAEGIYCADDRVVSGARLEVAGHELRWLSTQVHSATAVDFAFVVSTPAAGADPLVILVRERRVTAGGLTERLRVTSRLTSALRLRIGLTLTADGTGMEQVKAGRSAPTAPPAGSSWRWRDQDTLAELEAPAAEVAVAGRDLALAWTLDVAPGAEAVAPEATAPGAEATVAWALNMTDSAAAVVAASTPELPVLVLETADPRHPADPRLERLMRQAFTDLNSLRVADAGSPDETFLAAGAPWFYTMFGRDSLIAAQLLLPVDITLAAGTLRALASRQGTRTDEDTAEQPGKILHEVRRTTSSLAGEGTSLPPVYYGTIDATPLWATLLHDAWRAGMPEDEVAALLENLEAALGWLADHGDSDGDGFLEYLDTSGHGLANQGWKDSADSVRWHDGSLAVGPIALCEVQGYAYQAALGGAALLDAFGRPGGDRWRRYADDLAGRFRAAFWCEDELGRYPAIALDAEKRPVDGVASNMGHLLGTGILNAEESAAVTRRLLHPTMFSGYGIRTLSTGNGGYWPLRYHAGSVWSHDTAVILAGMLADGFVDEAATLARGLLAAAEGFDYRLPELFSGHPADEVWPPVPYPASCRPKAWSAASAVPVAQALGALPR